MLQLHNYSTESCNTYKDELILLVWLKRLIKHERLRPQAVIQAPAETQQATAVSFNVNNKGQSNLAKGDIAGPPFRGEGEVVAS